MPQEENEELNPQEDSFINKVEEALETSENAPAEEEEPTEELAESSEESSKDNLEESIEPKKVTILESEYAQLKKDREDKENYQKGLLTEKRKKREEELGVLEESIDVEKSKDDKSSSPDIRRDYLSKRADVMAEFKSKIAELSDEGYQVFKRHLSASEIDLLKSNKGWISRKEINEIFNDALGFVSFKLKTVKSDSIEDFGSTKTIRKVGETSTISERARELQAYTRDKRTGKLVSLETIQRMLDSGEIQ